MTAAGRRRLRPDTNARTDLGVYLHILKHVSITQSLRLSLRSRGAVLVSRGTRVRLARGARLEVPPGSFLFVGFVHYNPVPCAIHLGAGARLVVDGTVQFHRGVRVSVHDGACLRVGNRSYVNDGSVLTCFSSITIGEGCSISWNTNILDTHVHELVVDGEARPRSQPVEIGDHVWIGTGAVLLPGTSIGSGAVVGAGSVVRGRVDPGTVVVGNPARVVREGIEWRQ